MASTPRQKIRALVAVTDEDKPNDYYKRLNDLQLGRETLRNQNVPCSVGLAIPKVEAWLLADVEALNDVLPQCPTISEQSNPEEMTGRREDVKARLTELIERHRQQSSAVGQTDESPIHQELANAAKLERVRTRCPQGFARFEVQVVEMTRELMNSTDRG